LSRGEFKQLSVVLHTSASPELSLLAAPSFEMGDSRETNDNLLLSNRGLTPCWTVLLFSLFDSSMEYDSDNFTRSSEVNIVKESQEQQQTSIT